MAKQYQKEKNSLNMTGEYSVCSELHKRRIAANITFGKEKAVNIIIISDSKVWSIEVKTTIKNKWEMIINCCNNNWGAE